MNQDFEFRVTLLFLLVINVPSETCQSRHFWKVFSTFFSLTWISRCLLNRRTPPAGCSLCRECKGVSPLPAFSHCFFYISNMMMDWWMIGFWFSLIFQFKNHNLKINTEWYTLELCPEWARLVWREKSLVYICICVYLEANVEIRQDETGERWHLICSVLITLVRNGFQTNNSLKISDLTLVQYCNISLLYLHF